MRQRLRGLTLDVDGTLYSLRRMVLRHPLVMLGLADFFRALHAARAGMRGQHYDDFYGEQARRFAELRGMDLEKARRLIELAIKKRWSEAFRGLSPWRGLRRALESLSGRGLKLGLISDYPMQAKLEALGLADVPFGCRVVTEETGALKPHPRPFLLAAEMLSLEPAQVLHIGDREEHDVQGALAAGMKAALFSPYRRRIASRSSFVLRRWSLLEPTLSRLGWLE